MQFEKQLYQEECVNNIISVLSECDIHNNNFDNLSQAIDSIWQEKSYTQFKKTDKKRIDVLMETGTGKTFCYLKTIFEVHKQFGTNKFIIVVPRIAIKLGVIQNIKLTKEYFFYEYGKYLKYIDYPKDGLGKINHDFLKTNDLVILITTNSTFNSEKNKINKPTETLFESGSIWQGIKAKKPIIIIDEPHLLKGSETQKGLEKLKDSLQIRFGATFPSDKKDEVHHLGNTVYSLDSISAFRQYLVKGITVNTLINYDEQGSLKVSCTENKKNTFIVVYDINQVVYRKRIKKGDDIGAKTGLANFNGISATKINSNTVFLSNATTLKVSTMTYKLDNNEITSMVQATIKKHFKKEEMLFDKGIKALSLFFIPSIKDFREDQNNPIPKIKKIFEVEYKAKRAEVFKNTKNKKYKEYLKKDFDEQGNLKIHGGYFSGDKVSTKDKNAGFNKDDIGVNIILNEKEKLLSFDTPLRFIFSVWALQEGWDNPNIFTICKLADTTKESSRRQQVGRGLRIAIDRYGTRQTYKKLAEKEHDFYEINTLDMIVSGKEKEFIAMIQQEIQDASFSLVYDEISLDGLKGLGLDDTESALLYTSLLNNNIINKDGKILSSVSEFLKQNDSKLDFLHSTKTRFSEILKMFIDSKNFIKDGNKKIKKVNIRQRQWQKFKYLWETINKKSKITYKNIQEENILKEVAKQFNNENIESIQGKIYIQKYNAQNDTIENIEETNQEKHIFFKAHKIDNWLSAFIKEEKFSFPFMLKLLNKIDTQKIKNNPKRARERLLDILKGTFHNYLLNSASYEFLETNIYPNELQDKKGEKKLKIKYSQLGKDYTEEQVPKNLLYDTICFDSQIEKEIQQNDSEKIDNQSITVFAKLPKISIPTPYKTYNPDFVYLIETQGDRQLFLVVESKGYKSSRDITEKERKKIEYAEKFFKFLQNQLPGIDIRYKTRFNSQKLSDIL